MSQYGFGTGTMWGTATQDAFGNTLAVPTPLKFGELQDLSMDFSRDLKVLYGQNAMPVSVAGGKQKYEFKSKFARMAGRVFNDLYFGQNMTTGTVMAAYNDNTGSNIPSAAGYQLIVAPPGSGTWKRDLGVIDANGQPMARVASAPATGQYSVSAGTYTFAAADAGKLVFISYGYDTSVSTGRVITLQNQEMGATPIFGVDVAMKFQGKSAVWRFPNCVSAKLSFEPKQDDYLQASFDFSAFTDATGVIGWLSFTE